MWQAKCGYFYNRQKSGEDEDGDENNRAKGLKKNDQDDDGHRNDDRTTKRERKN